LKLLDDGRYERNIGRPINRCRHSKSSAAGAARGLAQPLTVTFGLEYRHPRLALREPLRFFRTPTLSQTLAPREELGEGSIAR